MSFLTIMRQLADSQVPMHLSHTRVIETTLDSRLRNSFDPYPYDPPAKTQVQKDREKREMREAEFHRLLKECREKGICVCSHIELHKNAGKRCSVLKRILREFEEQRIPYFHWSTENLKTLVKQRKIVLPKKRTKLALARILQQSDSQHPFRLMDLPSEIRLHIYGMVLGGSGFLEVSCCDDIVEPALLQTTRQIRNEAIPVFYAMTRFRFELQDQSYLDRWHAKRSHLFSRHGKEFLEFIDAEKIKSLRQVSFYIVRSSYKYELRVDLASSSLGTWVIFTKERMSTCSCQNGKAWTLLQLREHLSIDTEPEALHSTLDVTLETVENCITTANKAIQDFQALCSQGESLKPTLPGLTILAQAADSIIQSTNNSKSKFGMESFVTRLIEGSNEAWRGRN